MRSNGDRVLFPAAITHPKSAVEQAVETCRWIVEMTATGFGALPAHLRGRLDHGRTFSILGSDHVVSWIPGDADSVTTAEEVLLITLTQESTSAFTATIAPKRGTYAIQGLNVTFEVRTAQIRSNEGEVVKEVG